MNINRLKTLGLLAALTALLVWAGDAIGGTGGLVVSLALAFGLNFGAYWFSDRLVLAMHGARPADPSRDAELFGLLEGLCARSGLPVPKLYLMPEAAPNAFATGRDPEHAAVAVTAGLLESLDRREIEAVLAHELSHIQNRDTLVMTVAAGLAGALSMLADLAFWTGLAGRRDEQDGHPLAGIVGLVVAPLAATLIQLAVSRTREYLADESAARITGDPLALASALRRLESWKKRAPMESAAPATAHLFIVNPLTGGGLAELFSTHPPARRRIARLERMAGGVLA